MMVAGLTALDGRAMPKIALPSMVDTSDTTLNTARWWPVENEKGKGLKLMKQLLHEPDVKQSYCAVLHFVSC